MADRLEFDVEFNLGAAERQASAFESRFDKPIEVKLKFDQKALERQFQEINARLAKALSVKLDVDTSTVDRKVREAEKRVPTVKVPAEVDQTKLLAKLRAAVAEAEARTPEFNAKVKVDIETASLKARLKAATKSAEADLSGIGDQLSALGGAAEGAASGTSQLGGSLAGLANPATIAVVGTGALVAVLTAMPAAAAAAGGAVAALGLGLGAVGVKAATELEPILNALNGIENAGLPLAEVFGRELTALKAELATAFEPLVRTAELAFGPLNKFLAQFLAGISPAVNALALELIPVLNNLAATTAGPLGQALGRIITAFSKIAVELIPKLVSPRLVKVFLDIADAVAESGPGIVALVEALLDLLDLLAAALPLLVKVGNTFAAITAGATEFAKALSAPSITGSLPELGLNIWNANKASESAAGSFDTMGSSLGGASGKIETAGIAASRFGADVEALTKTIQDLSARELSRLPAQVLDTSQAVARLQQSFAAGQLTAAQLQNQLFLLRAESGLSDVAWQQATTAFDGFRTAADNVNASLGTVVQFTQLAADKQFFFLAALNDGKLSADEFAATMRATNLTNAETVAVFDQLVQRTVAFRNALVGMVPSVQTAFDAIDLRTVQSGQKFGALLNELRAQQSDTFAFFANLDKIIAAGAPDVVRTLLESGLDKQSQEQLAAEAAAAIGTPFLATITDRISSFRVDDAKLKEMSDRIAQQVGVQLPASLQDQNIQLPTPTLNLNDEDMRAKVDQANKDLTLLDGRTATVNIAAHDELGPVVTATNDSLNGLDSRAVFPTIGADDQLTGVIARLNQALDQLDGRVVTVDVLANVLQQTRRDGGPVWPGTPFVVNETGREAVADRLGLRWLPPGRRTMTFDRPGTIIPADQVDRVAALAGAPVGTITADRVVNNTSNSSPTIIVNGAGHHPMVVAKRVARFLP